MKSGGCVAGGGGACPCGDPQSVSLDLSYHKERQCMWFRVGI